MDREADWSGVEVDGEEALGHEKDLKRSSLSPTTVLEEDAPELAGCCPGELASG